MSEPHSARFRLSGPDCSLGLDGSLVCFTDLAEAETAVRTGIFGDIVAGSVPFDPHTASPSFYIGRRTPCTAPTEPAWTVDFQPDLDFNDAAIAEYLRLLDHVLPRLRAHSGLDKVVVARSERYSYTGPFDPERMYDRIAALYPGVHSYFVEHQDTPGVYTMGASPELFLRKRGDRIAMTPLAGTVPRDPGRPVAEDAERARAELFTDKYLIEHRHLVDFMVEGLAPLCAELEYPGEPELVAAPGVWHLGTPIVGRLLDPRLPVADLVATLHPSPAVCGVPQAEALRLITEYESARNYYGGLVGWLDSAGDCQFYMALRGLELDTRARHLTLRAGGGVVADSQVDIEFAETSAKLATMRRVLGAADELAVR
ncbi:isochorismate synthase MenF [Nocardia sp. NPDC050406]|uniref:isochorismate synthase MenF n=1 Tax=Nocardia sp. NPDC050406 TaxID=3364318 RepID=UPI0037AFC59D